MILLTVCWFLIPNLINGRFVDQKREMKEIITTTACRVRGVPYEARLDMYYFYKVVYVDSFDLLGLERALATSVASSLNECDNNLEPLYAVELSEMSHKESAAAGNLCDDEKAEGELCSVVRGETSILLDNGVGQVDADVYKVLEDILKDPIYLQQFTSPNLIRAAFVYAIGENLVILANSDDTADEGSGQGLSSGTFKVALSAVAVSVIVALIFVYGLVSNRKPDINSRSHESTKRAFFYRNRRLQYFEQLEEDPSLSQGWMMANDPAPATKTPSTTWSVSDLTSDTLSIKESLPMERIEEESAIDVHDDELPSNDASVSTYSPVKTETSDHILFMNNLKDPAGSVVGGFQNTTKKVTIEQGPQFIPRYAMSLEPDDKSFLRDDLSNTLMGSQRFNLHKVMHPDTDDDISLQVKNIDQFDIIPDFFVNGCSFWVDRESCQGSDRSDRSVSSDLASDAQTKAVASSSLDDHFTPERTRNFKADRHGLKTPHCPGFSLLACTTSKKITYRTCEITDHVLMRWAHMLLMMLCKCKDQKLLTKY